MATTFIRVPQTGGAPEDYLVSGAADIDMLSCAAHFDGTSAGVDFFPAIQVLDEAGQVSATVVGSKVTAGDSADVTFAPFLETQTAGGGADPTAVHYDLSPQVATFLESTTTNGTTINDSGAAATGVQIHSDDGSAGGGFVAITTDDGEVFIGSTEIVERISNGGTYQLQRQGAAVVIFVDNNGAVTIRLGSTQELNVLGPFSKKILKITDGGGGAASYEIQTGAAWVADL